MTVADNASKKKKEKEKNTMKDFASLNSPSGTTSNDGYVKNNHISEHNSVTKAVGTIDLAQIIRLKEAGSILSSF